VQLCRPRVCRRPCGPAMVDKNGELLKAAAWGRKLDVLRLLNEGAFIKYKNGDGDTALHLSSGRGKSQADVQRLVFRLGGVKAMEAVPYYSSEEDSTDVVKLLLEKGANVNVKNGHGWTALHYASRDGNTGVAAELMEKGADINAKTGTVGPKLRGLGEGTQALHLACESGHTDMVKLLLRQPGIELQHNSGIAYRNDDKYHITPLHIAKRWSPSSGVVQLLEEAIAAKANASHEQTTQVACKKAEIACKKADIARQQDELAELERQLAALAVEVG